MGKKLHVLLSAYACEPGKGSEPGVGWHWALEIARRGHSVSIVTRSNNVEGIQRELEQLENISINPIPYDLPTWARTWKKGKRGVQLYYFLWQWGAYRIARKLHAVKSFDLVHHLTFGVIRTPNFMGRLKVPLVVGPLGGGERCPASLMKSFPLKGRIREKIREISTEISVLNPLTRHMLRDAQWILCRTRETMDLVPRIFRSKCTIHSDIGVDSFWLTNTNSSIDCRSGLIIVARLLDWKGIHLGISAFAAAHRMRPDLRLTIIGKGRDESWLKMIAKAENVVTAIDWIPHLCHADLKDRYKKSRILLFPSLHDSGGSVTLEGLACGLPIICLDTGGPAELVPASCGAKISVHGESPANVVNAITSAILELYENQEKWQVASVEARNAAGRQTWNMVVGEMYEKVEAQIEYAQRIRNFNI